MDELQLQFQEVVGHALENVPDTLAPSWMNTVGVVLENFMDEIMRKVLDSVQGSVENMSDYENSNDSDGNDDDE